MRHFLVVLVFLGMVIKAHSQDDNCFGNSYEILQNFETTLECPAESWKLIFFDEFHGDQLNTEQWYTYSPLTDGTDTCRYCRTHPNEGQIYLDENVLVENGYASLITKREITNWYDEQREFSSGKLHSSVDKRFKYGKFEIRCKVPEGTGFWPAFWLYRFGDEMDIFEIGGDNPLDYLISIHTEHGQILGEHCRRSEVIPVQNLFENFHTYALEWEKNVIRWYFDEELIYELPKYIDVGVNGEEYFCPAILEEGNYLESLFFSQFDMEMIINLAIPPPEGNGFTNYPDETTPFPSSYDIDYVRVYQREIQEGFSNLCEDAQLIGNSTICSDEETYYYEGPFTQVEWNLSSNLQNVRSTDNSITVRATETGAAFVIAKIDEDGKGPCSTKTLIQEVQVERSGITEGITVSNGLINISNSCSGQSNETWTLNIFNLKGQLVFTKSLNIHESISIPVYLKEGVYLINLEGTNESITGKYFIVTNQ